MLKPHVDNAVFKVASQDNVLHVRIHSVLGAPEVHQLEQALASMAQAHAKGFAVFICTRQTDLSPPQEVRQATAEMLHRFEKNIVAVGMVLETDGLKATVVRAYMNTLMMAARMKVFKIFNESTSASIWLSERLTAAQATPQNAKVLAEDAKAMMRLNAKGAAGADKPTVRA